MKKIITLIGTMLITISAFSASVTDFETQMKSLEKEYQLLLKKEDQRYVQEKQIAATAESTLAGQKNLYKSVAGSLNELQQMEKYVFYKDDYNQLLNKYQTILKDLEKSMNDQQVIIDNFKQIQMEKEGNK
ncbi:adhesion protein FadA [Fusobacterium varium]|uniref:adhesion protein FadA n=1 Tax=Fusobacterium varium TaxID=856 RepID=UPI000BBADCB6|nr:adhesion protein FadA [uncultured Fusobacterium sp.]BBA51563.1 putative adhesion protein FadA [Fusobacterium varium]